MIAAQETHDAEHRGAGQKGHTMAERTKQQPRPISAEEARAESRRRREERKKAQQAAVTNGGWERCMYRVPGKKRYCAQYRSKHSTQYCGTHMGATQGKGKRVPCPVDPNHTVFEQQLASHVKICNLTLQQAQMETQPYYAKGINSGPPLPREKEADEAQSEEVAAALNEVFVLSLISRVAAAHQELVGDIPTEVLDPPEVQALHRARTEDGTGFRKGRHVLQHASLVGHLLKRGLVGSCGGGGSSDESNTRSSVLHVEMGAGKGALGLSIATAFPGADVTMVERSSVRRKAENRLDGVSARARIDIRDLDMAGLPSIVGEGDSRPVVAVAKHLCGVATDLALRAMLTLPPQEETHTTSGSVASDGYVGADICSHSTSATRVGGVAIATCCHHACNWRDYAGRDFLTQQGFTARDFEAIRRISAWISLEPDAGARKNNKYPEDRHPGPPSPLPPRSGQSSTAPVAVGGPQQTADTEAAAAEEEGAAGVLERSGDEDPDSQLVEHGTGEGGDVHLRGDHRDDGSAGEPGEQPVERAGIGQEERAGRRGETPSSFLTRQSPSSPPPRMGTEASLRTHGEFSTAPSLGTISGDQAEARYRTGRDSDDDRRGQPLLTVAPNTHPAATIEGRPAGASLPINALSLTPAEKAKAARECKRLLDRGRMAFIEARLGLRSEIVHFVGREITPENALLLGFRGGD